MGWMYMHREKGLSTKDYFAKQLTRSTLLEGAVVNGVFYAACRNNDNPNEVWALVCLTKWAGGWYNWGYKDMEESMGPCEAECPERILRLLTPTDSQYANEWRARCWENLRKRKSKPRVKVGDTVKFASPISFTNGKTLDTFKLVRNGRRGLSFQNGYGLYRITNWKRLDYEVLQSA